MAWPAADQSAAGHTHGTPSAHINSLAGNRKPGGTSSRCGDPYLIAASSDLLRCGPVIGIDYCQRHRSARRFLVGSLAFTVLEHDPFRSKRIVL
jgi:hypothetical protein